MFGCYGSFSRRPPASLPKLLPKLPVYFRIADLNILICVQPHEEKVTLGLGSLQETQP